MNKGNKCIFPCLKNSKTGEILRGYAESASTEKKNEPKVIGEVLNDYFASNEPLAVAFRNWKVKSDATKAAEAESEPDQIFGEFYPNTELAVDLKLITRQPGRMPVSAYLDGTITRDSEDHFCFIQNVAEKKKLMVTLRNPHIYVGKRINVNRKDDGSLHPTFNRPRYTKDFSFQDFCREAAEELLMVIGLLEE